MFVRPEVEVVKFEAIDVIATSPDDSGVTLVVNSMVLPEDGEEE